jgi:hemerythrin
MTAIDYPDRRQHLLEHEELRRKIAQFFKRFKRGEIAMTIEFSLFLSDSVGKHIRTSDRQFAEYLRKHENEAAVRSQFIKHLPKGLWRPASLQ